MHCHLVAVKVCIKRRTDQRMHLNRFPFDQNRLEGLDTQAVQRWRAIQKHVAIARHVFQNIPYFGTARFNKPSSGTHVMYMAIADKPGHDKRLEQLQSHALGQTALVQFQFRTNHNHRTPRIVSALAKQILAEATLLAFACVGERTERALLAR